MNNYYYIGLDCIKNKKYDQALNSFYLALESAAPADAGFIYEKIGFVLIKLSRFEESLPLLNRAYAVRRYYKTAVELCDAYAGLGYWGELEFILSSWQEDEKFLFRAQSCFYGGIPLSISLLFDGYFKKFSSSKSGANEWAVFYEKNKIL